MVLILGNSWTKRCALGCTAAARRRRSSPHGYNAPVYQLQRTDVFDDWLLDLRDVRAKARTLARLESARLGNLGGVRSVTDGVSEIRVNVGAGYRVYFTRRKRVVMCRGQIQSSPRYRARQALPKISPLPFISAIQMSSCLRSEMWRRLAV